MKPKNRWEDNPHGQYELDLDVEARKSIGERAAPASENTLTWEAETCLEPQTEDWRN